MSAFELAQLNVARARAPLDDPVMAGFVSRLAEINGLAEATPGFIWRLTDESGGDATGIRAYEDPLVIVNLTVWTGIEELFAFAYRTPHVELFRARRDWFAPFGSPHLVLWWQPADEPPTVEAAHLRRAIAEPAPAHGRRPSRPRRGSPPRAASSGRTGRKPLRLAPAIRSRSRNHSPANGRNHGRPSYGAGTSGKRRRARAGAGAPPIQSATRLPR